jgi:alkylated DNA repair protein alkB family protein 1
MQSLDPHQRPPASIRNVYKKYQKMKPKNLETDADVVDVPETPKDGLPARVHIVQELDSKSLAEAFCAFAGGDARGKVQLRHAASMIPMYAHYDMPGKASWSLPGYSCLVTRHAIKHVRDLIQS